MEIKMNRKLTAHEWMCKYFDSYANKSLPASCVFNNEIKTVGQLEQFFTDDGGSITIRDRYYWDKNITDGKRAKLIEWRAEHTCYDVDEFDLDREFLGFCYEIGLVSAG
jgi:hypothetical protein